MGSRYSLDVIFSFGPKRPLAAFASIVAAILVSLTLSIPAAEAHATLESVSPADKSTLTTEPTEVTLTFNDTMNRPSYVSVTAPDGKLIAEGEGTVVGTKVTQQVRTVGLAGIYRVDFRAVSADGHPVEGSFRYTVTSGTPASSDATSIQKPADRHLRWWILGIGGWVVLLGGVAVWVRRRS
ncbi:hypothetical protein BH09ACT10_BH09ACT10_05740 [soil metagenome]